MDIVTHACVGFAIAGPHGAGLAVVADAPWMLADAIAWWRSGMSIGDYAARRMVSAPPPEVRALFTISDVLHSGWALLACLLGPPGIAFASHAVIDWPFHGMTRLFPPFGTTILAPPGPRLKTDWPWRVLTWIACVSLGAGWRF